MKPMKIVIALLMSLASASAQTAPVTPPATGTKALVLLFEGLGTQASEQFIGKTLQQGVVADLSRSSLQASASDKSALANDAAIQLGREASARYVVSGSYQVVNNEVRINGQVLDVISGNSLGGLKATGNVRDLFALEDTVAEQAKYAIAPPSATTRPAPVAFNPQPPISIQVNSPVTTTIDQTATPQPDRMQPQPYASGYPYGYPYGSGYGYGYPYGNPYGYGLPYGYFPGGYVYLSGPASAQFRKDTAQGTSAFDYSHGSGHSAGPINPPPRLKNP